MFTSAQFLGIIRAGKIILIKVTRYCYLKSNELLLFVDAEIRLASFMKEKERDLQSVYLYFFLMTSLS